MAKSRREEEKSKRRRADTKKMMKTQEGGFEPTCVKLKDGLEFCKIQHKDTPVGTFKVDVLPYKCTEDNLVVKAGNADVGSELPILFYKCHKIKTPDNEFGNNYACRRAMFGKKCAVCDYVRKNGATLDEDLAKDLRAKDRLLMIFNMKPGAPKPVLQIFDTNSHGAQGSGFFDQLNTLIQSDESYLDYWIPEEGRTLKLTTAAQKGFAWHPVTRIDMLDRKVQYDPDIADEMPNPEEFIIDPGYDEVMKLLTEGGEENDSVNDDDDAPKGNTSRDEEDDDNDDGDAPVSAASKKLPNAKKLGIKVGDLVEYDGEECEVIHVSGDGTSLKLKDEDGEVYKGVGPDEVSLIKGPNDADDEEDEEPTTRGAKAVSKNAKKKVDEDEEDDIEEEEEEEEESDDDSDDDEDEEDEEEDEPAPKKGKGKPPAKKSKDDDEDEDEDDDMDGDHDDEDDSDDSDEDDEEEDDEPAPKKAPVKKPAPKKGGKK